ncbi:hypothetical protein NDU88_007139 [Pleurodeles waltl]|uniref:Uncharacterized protein n=1 Tax=Pleurodeles waltl TaxID=8319 RepID=A0AAV7RRI0_PLEWA|nr:hypothetical protein NDU88_007139 [Pleurodeles waltl]
MKAEQDNERRCRRNHCTTRVKPTLSLDAGSDVRASQRGLRGGGREGARALARAPYREHWPPLTSPLTGNARHLSTTPRASSPTGPTAGRLHRRSVVPGPPRRQGSLHARVGHPALHRPTRLLDPGAQDPAVLRAPAPSTTSGPQCSPRRTPAAQRPPGPPPRHLSRPHGHQAQARLAARTAASRARLPQEPALATRLRASSRFSGSLCIGARRASL